MARMTTTMTKADSARRLWEVRLESPQPSRHDASLAWAGHGIPKASADVLKGRKILSVRRRGGAAEAPAPAPTGPFAAFGAGSDAGAAAAAASTPFAAFGAASNSGQNKPPAASPFAAFGTSAPAPVPKAASPVEPSTLISSPAPAPAPGPAKTSPAAFSGIPGIGVTFAPPIDS